jgi:hypothetical protein
MKIVFAKIGKYTNWIILAKNSLNELSQLVDKIGHAHE